MKTIFIEVERSWTSILILTILVYFICHGLMLFVYGAWWDDMMCWNVSQEVLDEGYKVFNNPFIYYIIKYISYIQEMKLMTFVYRIVPFMCWLISVISFFIFCKLVSHDKSFTLYASLLAASCGLNKCMLLICCFHYSISIAFFMVGLSLFVYDYYYKNIVLRLCVAILWLFSLLVWRSAVLVIPVAIITASIISVGYDQRHIIKSAYKICGYLIRNYYLILISLIIFAILYLTLLAPKGDYASYYSISIMCFLVSPLTTLISSFALILNYIGNVVLANNLLFSNGIAFLFFCFFFVLFFNWIIPKISKINEETYISSSLIFFALIFLFFSMMPHLFREFCFSFDINGYKSRVASLAVFPIAMLLGYLFRKSQLPYKNFLFSAFLLFSSLYSIKTYANYKRGWEKNVEIAQFLKSRTFLNGCKLKFMDTAVDYSTFPSEHFRNYDMEGCARLAYGINTKTTCSNYYYMEESEYDYLIYIYQNNKYGETQMIRNYLIESDDSCHIDNLNFKLLKNTK